jgi:hypothetical protein
MRLFCPACDRKYRFKPELAGRKAQCKCGATLRMPADEHSPIQLVSGGKTSSPTPAPKPAAPEIKLAAQDNAMSIPLEPADPPKPSAKSPPVTKANGFVDLDSIDIGLGGDEHDAPASAGKPGAGSPLDAKGNFAPGNVDSYDLDIELEPTQDLPPPTVMPAGEILQPVGGTPAAKAAKGSCPSCGQAVKPGAVICLNCGYNIKEGKKITTQVGDAPAPGGKPAKPGAIPPMGLSTPPPRASLQTDDAESHVFTEFYGPLAVLVAGVLFLVLNLGFLAEMAAQAEFESDGQAMAQFLGTTYQPPTGRLTNFLELSLEIAFQIILTVPFTVGAIFVMGMIFGTELGQIGPAVLKLASIIMFMVGLSLMLDSVFTIVTGGDGWVFGNIKWLLTAGAFYCLAVWLLDYDSTEATVFYLLVYFVPKLIMVFGGLILINHLTGG